MESKYKKKPSTKDKLKDKKAAAEKQESFRKLTLDSHKIELLLIKLVIETSGLEERSEAETILRHSLDYIKKATRLLARNR